MRIAILAEAFEHGGAERQAAIWAKLCAEAGHEVTAVETRSADFPFPHPGIRVVPMLKPKARDIVPLLRGLRRLEREVDALVAFQPFLGLCCAAAGLRRPWMIVNGKVPATLSEGSRIPPAVFRLAFNRATLASSPCQGMVDAHLQLGIRRHRPWLVIPNIVLDEAFGGGSEDREGALFVGRLMPVKNPELAVASAAAAGVPLTLLGTGALKPQLEARIAALPDPRPEILPYDPTPWHVYARHRVLVVTSEVESFGNVLVESLAAGTPVVSVDCDFGPREIITGARYSRLTSRSPDEIGEALAEATQRPYGEDEARECREIADRYRPAAVYPLIDEALKRLVDRSGS